MAHVLCLDTEPETVQTLRAAGHIVETGEIGYRTGRPIIMTPPHEFDLLISDLRRPACFDATHWGPGGNDNFKCKIEKSINDVTYLYKNGRARPKFELIKTSQMPPRPEGTFGPSDVFRAVDLAGIPMLLFLNPEWIRHIAYRSPNFFDMRWNFERTKATKLMLTPLIKDILPEIDDSISLAVPLEFHLADSAHWQDVFAKHFFSPSVSLITNAVSQVFGEVVVLNKGAIWALPQFDDNARVCNILLERFDSFIATQSSLVSGGAKSLSAVSAKHPYVEGNIRDVFISHASEDKLDIARPLAEALKLRGLSVWFDEYELTLGDSLRRKIEEGLRSSRFGVTILSHHAPS